MTKEEKEEQAKQEKALLAKIKDQAKKQLEELKGDFVSQEAIDKVKTDLEKLATKEEVKVLTDTLSGMKVALDAAGEKAKPEERATMKALIMEHSEEFKAIRANKSISSKTLTVATTKGLQGAGDIGGREFLAETEAGIGRIPVRQTTILDLFKVDTVSKEYLQYWEEDVVTRDAKFVIACAASVHATKKTWKRVQIELAKIRDITEVCVDMLEDYDFVASELSRLVFESIALIKENELLVGLSANPTDLLSIDFISSEFDATNALAPFGGVLGNGFDNPNLEQLADSMAAQISIFGQQNSFMANTIIMNFADFVRYRNLRDANGNKLIHTLSDNIATIAGLRVVTSPLVAANTCYVLDTNKGRIKQRKGFTSTWSYENNDNIEHELCTLVAYERVQFHVRLIDRDSFMKCTDIKTAITAITNV